MTREEKLEAIWNGTHAEFKGIAGESGPGDWPAEHHGKRFVLDRGGNVRLLEDLSDDEIDIRMSVIRPLRANRRGPRNLA
jgi:hypothetical protein